MLGVAVLTIVESSICMKNENAIRQDQIALVRRGEHLIGSLRRTDDIRR